LLVSGFYLRTRDRLRLRNYQSRPRALTIECTTLGTYADLSRVIVGDWGIAGFYFSAADMYNAGNTNPIPKIRLGQSTCPPRK
jgi:hypothetical protein